MNSRLYLETEAKDGRTDIKDVFFSAPYKVMSPFQEGDGIQIMQMSASAGLLDGDTFTGEFCFGEHSVVTYLSQSYEKIFCSKGHPTKKEVSIEIKSGAKVKYLPYPVIPFGGSDFLNETVVHMKRDAIFLYGDVFTCGRTGMGEYFQMKRFDSRMKVYLEDKIVFADHTRIEPQRFCYQNLGMWHHYTHNGMLYIYLGDEEKEKKLIEEIRERFQRGDWLLGATSCESGVMVRILSMSGEQIYQMFKKIADMV